MDAYIKKIAYYLPQKIVTNDELVMNFPEWNAVKVASKVGILERHIAASDETATDMAQAAAEQLFLIEGIERSEIDFLLYCTQSPDYFLPTSACLLQHRLKLKNDIGALDFNLGCSGYVYGLSLAKGLIAGGIAKNILLITSETYNKYIHPQDKGNRSLFGDGAAATLISTDGMARIGNFILGTDGSGAGNLIVESGASRMPERKMNLGKDEGGYLKSSDYLYMNGSEIFNFTLEAIPPLIEQTLLLNGVKKEDIDKFIFHQANKFMLDTLRKVCGITKNKFYVNLERTGNTVSSTLPIAIKDSLSNNVILEGNTVLITGFGVGYSYGACVLYF